MVRTTIARKLAALVTLAALATTGMAALAGDTASVLRTRLTQAIEQDYPSVRAALGMQLAKTAQANHLRGYILNHDGEMVDAFNQDGRDFHTWYERYMKLTITANEREHMQAIDTADKLYATAAQEVIGYADDLRYDEAERVVHTVLSPIEDQIATELEWIMDFNDESVARLTERANATVASTTLILLTVPGAVLAVIVVAGWFIGRSIIKPLRKAVKVIGRISKGDLTAELHTGGRDEIADLANALNHNTAETRRAIETMAGTADAVSAAAERVAHVASATAAAARESSAQATAVASSAQSVSHGVEAVSSASAQMTGSITDIATNTTEAAQIASAAVTTTEAANAVVDQLSTASAEISAVLETIATIASQTSLLAINATIEAAHAGDAGKGFAVVADEVKELSQETGRATEDIGRRIQAIQRNASAATSAIRELNAVIVKINSYQYSIAHEVEEQTVTTIGMNRNVDEAANGASMIADNVTRLAGATKIVVDAAEESNQTIDTLTGTARQLRAVVSRFVTGPAPSGDTAPARCLPAAEPDLGDAPGHSPLPVQTFGPEHLGQQA